MYMQQCIQSTLRLPRRRLAWWLAGGTAVVLAVATTVVLYSSANKKPAVAATIVKVQRGTVTTTVSAAGTAQPLQSRGLNFSMSGTITELDVKPGDTVTVGQVLARIDATTAQSAVDAAQTQVTNAQDAVTRAESTTTSTASTCQAAAAYRIDASPSASASASASPSASASASASATSSPTGASHSTGPGGSSTGGGTSHATGAAGCAAGGSSNNRAGSSSTSDSLLAAQQQLNNAEHTLDQQKTKLAGTVISAPVAGRILSVGGVIGSTASTSSSGFIVLAGTNDVAVKAQFTEAEVAKLAVGQTSTITLPNLASQVFNGTVLEIDPAGTISSKLVRYSAVISFDKLPDTLLFGQTANVAVITESAANVLYVPGTAVTGRNGSTATVMVHAQSGNVRRTVQICLRGDVNTEIQSGLAEGEEVLSVGQ
jgi:multidrug efflux pump subunit AcrA (membrane-fusion protein)